MRLSITITLGLVATVLITLMALRWNSEASATTFDDPVTMISDSTNAEAIPSADSGDAVSVYFDADSDEAGTIHVAWRATNEGEVTYVRRSPSGDWGDPRVLGGRGQVYVLTAGSRVRVLVLAEGLLVHSSDDGGETWTTDPHLPGFMAWDGTVTMADNGSIVLTVAGWQSTLGLVPDDEARVGYGWAHPKPYPGRSSGKRLDAVAFYSRDVGATWSDPRVIGELGRLESGRGNGLVRGQSMRLSTVPRDMSAGGADLYLSLSQMWGAATGMRFSRSTDNGETWSALSPLSLRSPRGTSGDDQEAADVVGSGSRIALVHRANGGVAVAAGEPSGLLPPTEWREVHSWERRGMPHPPIRSLSRGDGSIIAVWNDDRRAKREWYAGSPLAIFAGNSGVWAQTDLFWAEMSEAGITTSPRPVTPEGSRVWGASKLFRAAGRVCTVWRGTTDAGRYGGEPAQLYLSCLPAPSPP